MPIEDNIILNETLRAYKEAGQHLYLLIEGAGSNPVARERLFYESDGLQFIPIYINTDYAPIIRCSPQLVILERSNEFFDWFIYEGPEVKAGIILTSWYDAPVVLRHLQSMIEVRLPDYNLAAFRYHDPTVLDRYVRSVDVKAQERVLGPMSAILWPKQVRPDAVWEWHALYSLKAFDEEAPRPRPQSVIEITKEELGAFEQACYEDLARRLLPI